MNFVKTALAHPFPVAEMMGFLVITLFIELFRKQLSHSTGVKS